MKKLLKKLLKKFIKNQYISDIIFTDNHIKDVFIAPKKEIEIFTNGYIENVFIERYTGKPEHDFPHCAEVSLKFFFPDIDSFSEFSKKMTRVHKKRMFKVKMSAINENNSIKE